MSSYFSANTPLSPVLSSARPTSCAIKGRLIPYEEFIPRLKNFCLSLGFKKTVSMTPQSSPNRASLDPSCDQNLPGSAQQDSVIILSTRVPYEPSWGVYGGLPRPLIHEKTDCRTEGTVSHFIAPYLVQYHFAQNHIYLSCKKAGRYLVTLPADLIGEGTLSGGKNLKIRLDKFTEPDENGNFVPVMVADSFISFPLSEQFLLYLRDNQFSWKAGKVQRIGTLLTADLFAFKEIQQSGSGNGKSGKDGSKSNFVKTLLPVMNRIVTHANPQLRAAILYLKNEFTRLVDEILHTQVERKSANLLCIAGLDIDVASFKGRGERYFVPWSAYWQQGPGQDDDSRNQLQQDDLFVALMAQGKQS
jgi:hypothetical protein